MEVKENQPLAPLTTFGIGGPARYFVAVRSEAELREAGAAQVFREPAAIDPARLTSLLRDRMETGT